MSDKNSVRFGYNLPNTNFSDTSGRIATRPRQKRQPNHPRLSAQSTNIVEFNKESNKVRDAALTHIARGNKNWQFGRFPDGTQYVTSSKDPNYVITSAGDVIDTGETRVNPDTQPVMKRGESKFQTRVQYNAQTDQPKIAYNNTINYSSKKSSQKPRTSGASTKPRTSSRPRTFVQRTTQQNAVTPIQPTQTWHFTTKPMNGNLVETSGDYKLIAPNPTRNKGVESLDELTSRPVLDNNSNNTIYDRNYVRSQRFNNYSNVDQFLEYVKNNPNSDEARLLRQNGFDIDKNPTEISDMLALQGIRGNLGRRDSRRLGNVLTRLRNQSTVGTSEHDQFMQGAVEQFNANKQQYSPTQGKYAGRTFRDLQYDPTKGNEAISFVGNDTDDMEGWFEPPSRQHLILPYLQKFMGKNIYNPFFDIFGNLKGGYNPTIGLENINKWWIPFINKSINTPGTGGYDVSTLPYFGFNRTLY